MAEVTETLGSGGVASTGSGLMAGGDSLDASVGTTVRRRVLLVGEGNFSFAYGLRHCKEIEVLATGYDAEQVLVSRYPEAVSICAKLRQSCENIIGVMHGVDANHLHFHAALKCLSVDDVVFTHPHLGTEDTRAHSSLLGHFFHSARRLLEMRRSSSESLTPQGRVHVTLAAEQATLWRIEEQAQRNGLDFLGITDFDDTWFDGYERRRTLSGRSFASRAASSRTFTFAAPGVGSKARPLVPWRCYREATTLAGPTEVNGQQSKGRSAKLRLPENTEELAGEDPFHCIPCAKRFRTPQGLNTHCRQVHKSGSGRKPSCLHCGRKFSTMVKLEQHIAAKHHGQDTSTHTVKGGASKPTVVERELLPGGAEDQGCSGSRIGATEGTTARGQPAKHQRSAPSGTPEGERAAKHQRSSTLETAAAGGQLSKPLLACPHCSGDRNFPNMQALAQHLAAKHQGPYTDTRPDWFCKPVLASQNDKISLASSAGSSEDSAASPAAHKPSPQPPHPEVRTGVPSRADEGQKFTCAICGENFQDSQAREEHVRLLSPREKEKQACRLCGKLFSEVRALQQHANTCFRGIGPEHTP